MDSVQELQSLEESWYLEEWDSVGEYPVFMTLSLGVSYSQCPEG